MKINKEKLINLILFVFYMVMVLEQGTKGMFLVMCYGIAMLFVMYFLLCGLYLWFALVNEIVKGE